MTCLAKSVVLSEVLQMKYSTVVMHLLDHSLFSTTSLKSLHEMKIEIVEFTKHGERG